MAIDLGFTDPLSGNRDLIIFQIPYGRHSFDYYYEVGGRPSMPIGPYRVYLPAVFGSGPSSTGGYRWADGLYTNGGMDKDEVARRMRDVTEDASVIWLVATEEPLWDERELVRQWLDGHALNSQKAEFARVTVLRYLTR